jgi:GAF domain-containing protein/ActR/RegA family two-component response regulator
MFLVAVAILITGADCASAETIHATAPQPVHHLWWLSFLFVFASMSSFGWSRFVPETIGHDTERLNTPGAQEPPHRAQLSKFQAEDMFRFNAALGTVEITDLASPAPHVLILTRGCELSGTRSGWAAILDTQGKGIQLVSAVEDGQPVAIGETESTPLSEIPELIDYLTLGKPCTIEPSVRKQPATRRLFGEPQRGVGLLVPMRSGADVLGLYYWLGVPQDLTAENVRVVALSAACSLLAARLDGLGAREQLQKSGTELAALTQVADLIGTPSREAQFPERVLAVVRDVYGVRNCRLFLADERGRELTLAARISDLPEVDAPRAMKIGSDGVAAQAAAKREPVYVSDVLQHAGYVAFSEGVRSEYCIPLVHDGRLLGVLDVESGETNGISSRERGRLVGLAAHLTAVMENYRLIVRELMGARKQSVLANIGHAAVTGSNPSEFLERAAQAIANCFEFGHVYLFLQPEQKDFLVLRARSCREEPALPLHFRASTGRGVLGYTARTSTTLLANDVSREALYFAKLPGMNSELCLPISADGKLLGVIDLLDRRKGAFSLDDVSLLEAAADFLAAAMQRHEAFHLARGRASQFALIDRVTRALLGARTVAELLDSVYAELATVIDLKRASILARTGDSCTLRVVASHAEPGGPSIEVGTEFSLEDSQLADVVVSGRPVVISNFEKHAGEKPLAPVEVQMNSMGVRSLILLPVVYDGEVQAVFALCSTKSGALREDHVELLEPVAHHFGVALKGACGGRLVATNEDSGTASRSHTASVTVPPGKVVGDILESTRMLLTRLSGENPSDEAGLRASLEAIEQAASKASELFHGTAARHGETHAEGTEQGPMAAQFSDSSATRSVTPSLPTGNSRRILVLDDQESILDIVLDILTSAGHSVLTSTKLPSALEALAASRFDLVLSDWSLDGGNAQPLIQAAVQAGVSVIITTGWRGELDEAALSRLGVKAILHKPFDVKRLLHAVAKFATAPAELPRA